MTPSTTPIPFDDGFLLNGGFEDEGEQPRTIVKWKSENLGKGRRVCNTSTKPVAYAGNCALKLKGAGAVLWQKEPLTEGQSDDELVFTGWFRSKLPFDCTIYDPNDSEKVQITTMVRYSDRKATKKGGAILSCGGTNGNYTPFTVTHWLRGTPTNVQVKIQTLGYKTQFWLDNLAVKVTTSTQPTLTPSITPSVQPTDDDNAGTE